MSRLRNMGPPPSRLKAATPAKNCESKSVLLNFDDLMRNEKVLIEGESEKKFLQFVLNQEVCRKKWEAVELEVLRVQVELQNVEQEVKKLEMKLGQARELLAAETNLRKKAKNERDMLSKKWDLVRELISAEQGGHRMNDETRLRLAKLDASVHSKRGIILGGGLFSPSGSSVMSPGEVDSTCSILDVSDLSFDNTQGTLGGEDTKRRFDRVFVRKSSGGIAQVIRRSKQRKSVEAMAAASAKQLMGSRNSSGLVDDASSNQYQERNIDDYIDGQHISSNRDERPNGQNLLTSQVSSATLVPKTPSQHESTTSLTPSQCSTATLVASTTPHTPVARSASNAGMMIRGRMHQFVQKNIFRTEVCGPCQKRIKFGKICVKCKECRAISHPECRRQVQLPCVPIGSATKTPQKAGIGRILSDYTPLSNPMVPAIVVYCINEIEDRGLEEVGLYRVPGGERSIKDLSIKFLAGRGCPNISDVDLHTLTGVVTDFLRSLREPLIPQSMWWEFTQAAANPDTTDCNSELLQAISQMPQPNRDTLAFFVLHLQKVSESDFSKMSASNLAKILGPTIVGFSTPDPTAEEMIREVDVQATTLKKLIEIDGDYWKSFFDVEEEDYRDSEIYQSPYVRTPSETRGMSSIMPRRVTYQQQLQTTSSKIFSSPVLQ